MAARKARRVSLKGSVKGRFAGRYAGPARRDERITVTLRLRRSAPLAAPVKGGEALDYDQIRARHGANARVAIVAITLAMHDHAPMRQFVHRPDRQPAAPVEELALLISQRFPQAWCVLEHTAVQRNVVAARDDLQWVELQVLHRAHGLLGACDAVPAPPRPQALLAEDEATGRLDVDGQHDGPFYRRAARRIQILRTFVCGLNGVVAHSAQFRNACRAGTLLY